MHTEQHRKRAADIYLSELDGFSQPEMAQGGRIWTVVAQERSRRRGRPWGELSRRRRPEAAGGCSRR